MERLAATLGRAQQDGLLTAAQAEALAREVARWQAAGRPPVELGAFLAAQGLPPVVVRALVGLAEGSDGAGPVVRLADALRAGPLGAGRVRGATLGRWVVEGELGRGGMGVVLRARARDTGQQAALKVLLAGAGASPEQRRRFQREAETLAGLDHPGIVRVLGHGEEDGLAYLELELIDGAPLDLRALPLRKRVRALVHVARALEHAHARGLVHRDVKPANVLVRAAGGEPVLTDFGLVRDVDAHSSLTRSGQSLGTPHYMAPEQVRGEPCSPATDVFALGVMLYEALTETRPFDGDGVMALLDAVQRAEPEPPRRRAPGTPPALERTCLRALARTPAARHMSAGEVARELDAWLQGRAAAARPGGAGRRVAVGVLALGGLGVAIGWSKLAPGDPAPPGAPSVETQAAAPAPVVERGLPAGGGPAAPAAPERDGPDGSGEPPAAAPPEKPGDLGVKPGAPTGEEARRAPDPPPLVAEGRAALDAKIRAKRAEVAATQARIDATKLALEAIKLLPPAGPAPARALEAAEAAVLTDPTLGPAWFSRAAVRAANGDGPGALRDLEEAERAAEPVPEASLQLLRGELLLRGGRADDARAPLARVLALAPKNQPTNLRLAVALQAAGDAVAAIELLERLEADREAGWRPSLALCRALLEAGRGREAEAAARRAIGRASGKEASCLAWLARVLARTERLADAEESLRPVLAGLTEAPREGPELDAEVLVAAADLRVRSGQAEAGEALARRALASGGGADAAAVLAEALLAQGRTEDARTLAREARARHTNAHLERLIASLGP